MLLTHPEEGKQSLSLTLLAFCFVALTTAGVLEIVGKTTTCGPFENMFYTSVALYFGRRFSVNGKSFTADQTSEELTVK